MKNYDYDLFIVGAGSGGVRTGKVAASLGAKVAIAEEKYLGGTCVNVGCIPKKLFVYASYFSEEFQASRNYGWNPKQNLFNWKTLLSNKNKEIKRLNGIYENILSSAGVEIISGRATLTGPNTIMVKDKRYTAETILIATGAWPSVPQIPGREHVITSNEAFFLDSLPDRIVIVGGGYIAVEFGGIFNGLGVDTTLIYRGPLLLRGFDHEMCEFLTREIENKGIRLVTNTTVEAVHQEDMQYRLTLSSEETLTTDLVMFATGRLPNTNDLGLETVGVRLHDNQAIMVNEHYQTSIDSIYAIGDVANPYALTPVAIAEGMALARSLYGGSDSKLDYNSIPTCIFSQPSFATVGHTEQEARRIFPDIHVYKSDFTPLKHSLSGIREKTLMKLIVDAKTDKVVGAHMVGHDAGEIIQGIAIAMKAGATKSQFDSTIGIHPTAAEEFVTMQTPYTGQDEICTDA